MVHSICVKIIVLSWRLRLGDPFRSVFKGDPAELSVSACHPIIKWVVAAERTGTKSHY